MKRTILQQQNKWGMGAALAATVLAPVIAFGGTFSFDSTQDVGLAFVKSGSPDLIVDLGSYGNLEKGKFSINLEATLTSVFGSSLDGVKWSAFGTIADPNSPVWKSLFATDPQTINGSPSAKEWQNKSSGILGQTSAKIVTAGNNLNTALSLSLQSATVMSDGVLSIVPNGSGTDKSFSKQITTGGNFSNFQGNTQKLLPTGFSLGSAHSQQDLFQLTPTDAVPSVVDGLLGLPAGYFNGTSSFMGTFDLAPDGVLSWGTIGQSPTDQALVPETSSFALVGGLGLLAFAGYRRVANKI